MSKHLNSRMPPKLNGLKNAFNTNHILQVHLVSTSFYFGSVFKKKNSDSVRNDFWFGLTKHDLVQILQLFTSYVIDESLIYSKYYSVTAMLNELCILDFDS